MTVVDRISIQAISFAPLLLFHHLYSSNQNTEANPTIAVMPNCIPFSEAILKKAVMDGT